MKKGLLIIVACISISLKSQISITSNNMPISGDVAWYTNASLNSVGDYTTTGANHTWDFSSLDSLNEGLREFKAISNTPYGMYSFILGFTAYGELATDTVPIPTIPIPGVPVISITDIYNFYSKTSTKFIAEGLGVKINGIGVPNTFSNEDELYFFPLNYSDRDSSTFRFSTISNTIIPFQYIKQGHRITEVDGWGTVTTPYGTEQCIRVVTTQYSIDTFKGTITLPVIGTQPFAFGFPNYVRSYQWLTLGEKIPYFEVTGNIITGNFNATQAKYRDDAPNFVSIKEEVQQLALSVFPNPSTNQLTIITPKNGNSIKAELVDLQGKTVFSKDLNNNSNIANQHILDVNSLAKGIYILNLSNLEAKQSLKISIQ